MSTSIHRRTARSAFAFLPVAVLPALAVVAIYEIRGRTTKPTGPEPAASVDAGPPLFATSGPSHESCGALRRRYLARCSVDLSSTAPAPGRPAATDGPPNPESNRDSEERAIAERSAWLNPSAAELAEMARRCEVRFAIPAITENQPPAITDQQASTLSLSGQERALLERTLHDLHGELRDFAAHAVDDAAGGSPPAPGMTLEQMLAELEMRSENGFEEARQQLAQERAGLAQPPQPGARQPPGERLLRLWAGMGNELERRLAEGLGAARARQLRLSPHATWIDRFVRSGCASPPPP